MQTNLVFSKSLLFLALTSAFSTPIHAEESDMALRIKELEAKMLIMQQQRAEQDKQLELITKELVGIENQLSQSKIAKTEEKGSSKGAPVYAAFKDGITLEDGSGNWKLAINGRIQGDYRKFSPDVDAADTFSLRRARLGGTLTFYKDYVARIEGEYSSATGTSLTYGYIDINKFQAAKFRLGQFKPNYGLERAMSSNFTDFQERSMGDALLGSTYDRGVMVFGSPTASFNYSLAYINGSGTADENNAKTDGKDVTARLTANLSELLSWQNSVVHFGGFYADGNQGSRRQAGAVPAGTTDARGLAFFQTNCGTNAAGAVTAAVTAACGGLLNNGFGSDVTRTRSGLEAALAYGPVKLQSEYIKVKFDGSDFNRQISDWVASAVWNVSGESFSDFYKDGVFGRLRPKNNYKEGAAGWGAFQVGLRYDQFDGSDFKASNAAGTGVLLNAPASTTEGLLVATHEADSWTLGANWILNPNVRLVANLIRTRYDTPVTVRVNGQNETLDHEDALTIRAQFDF
ncbi:MAG: OprO/OprP family phosphate-selective porin [Methylophilaceae bacterium]